MKFGICCPISFIPSASNAGYDYVELGVSSALLPETTDENHVGDLQEILAKHKMVSDAFNFMLAPGLLCVGPQVDEERIRTYFAVALPRAAAVGARTLVFGSGTQRRIPEGFSAASGRSQYKKAVELAAAEASQFGITIAIEPLNHLESNLINSVAEGTSLALEIDQPSVKVLSDLYHVITDHQPFSETSDAGSLLTHVHVAGEGRRAPVDEDLDVLTNFFRAVRGAGYDSRVSVECNWQDLGLEAPIALNVVKEAWLASD